MDENGGMAVEKDDIQYFGCKYALPVGLSILVTSSDEQGDLPNKHNWGIN